MILNAAGEALRRWVETTLLRLETVVNAARRETGRHVAEKAGVAAEAAGNASHVPREVLEDAKVALGAWGRSVVALLGIVLAALVFGTVVLVLVTVGLVVALNMLLGDPWGTLAVAALYVVLAAVLVTLLARAARRSNETAKAAVEHAKDDVALATRPPRHPSA